MRFLPIVERELRTSARRWRTYWTRVVFVSIGLAVCAFVYFGDSNASAAQFGEGLMVILGALAIVYSMAAGTILTADCLSVEKREGTLGLLFLTDLKGYDVVFGKMAAMSLRGFSGLVAVIPLLAIPLMSGGVTYGAFARLALAVTNVCLFSLAVGLFISARIRSALYAMLVALLVTLLCIAVPMVAAALIDELTRGLAQKHVMEAAIFSPCWAFFLFPDQDYATKQNWYWSSVGICWAWTCLFLGLACWTVPRAWQDRPAGRVRLALKKIWRGCLYGNDARQKEFRTALLDVNAFYWLSSRVRSRTLALWLALVAVAGLWGWGCVVSGGDWFSEGVYFPTAIILNFCLKFCVSIDAGREFSEGREERTLEAVLAAGISDREILRGKWLALRRRFQTPLTLAIGVQLVFLAASLQRQSFHDNALDPVLWLASIILLLADLAAIVWVGMWSAMTTKTPRLCAFHPFIGIVILPTLAFFLVIAVLSYCNENYRLGLTLYWPLPVGLWFGMGLATDLIFGLGAWQHLRKRFRQLALKPAVSRAAFRLARQPETTAVASKTPAL